ncbi:MAG: polyprenyl synthetase family protein [Candidatus Omnitrophica bacterium]|nr:polyprenyl synthetase family protein [Candidatus Omnitrophota bacterium]
MKETISLDEIYAPIEEPLLEVPDSILSILSTPNELASEVIRYFFSRQGKYLRPALTFFGAAIENHQSSLQEEKLSRLAAAFEIFHSATLIHDDIIDSAHIRRNIPTINVKWSPQVAVLVGDYLHDKAISAIFECENGRVISLFLRTAGLVCDGEIHELREKNNFNLKEDEYLEIIHKKTASLIACCIESGAILTGLPIEKVEALKRFGRDFGMAFQIVDDCLDFMGEEHEFGKTLGTDAEEGVLTLPLIRLMQVVDEPTKSKVFKIFKRGIAALEDVSDASNKLRTLKELLAEYGALDYAMAKGREFTEKARLELSIFADSPIKRSLNHLLDYVLDRNR